MVTTSDRSPTVQGTEAASGELAGRLRLALTRMARRLRQEAGSELSPSQLAALATIERHGPITPSELADLERIQRPTATRVLGILEGRGLVLRQPDPTDGRSALVSVSPHGRVLLRALRRRKTAYLARRLQELDPQQLAALDRAAQIIEELLEGERA